MWEFISGYKTYIAGVGMICTGLGMIAAALTADHFFIEALWEGVGVVAAGFGMMGFRHAIEKKEPAPPA
jgi:hypothetical protein